MRIDLTAIGGITSVISGTTSVIGGITSEKPHYCAFCVPSVFLMCPIALAFCRKYVRALTFQNSPQASPPSSHGRPTRRVSWRL
jgi:hypothetical protein